jgi:polar amino acid transport system substrate-binding protein
MRTRSMGFAVVVAAALTLVGACASKTATPPGGTSTSASPSAGPSVIPSPTKDATIAAEVPADIAAKGSLKVATDATYAPNEFFAADNKTIQGWDIDLGHAIGAVLGLEFKFENATFAGIIPGLASGKYDISMSSFTDNKEREQTVDMVTYYTAGTSFYVKASGGPDIETLADLCGHTLAAEQGTTQADDGTAQSKKCTAAGKQAVKVLIFPDYNGANLALVSGRADVAAADSPVAAYQVKLSNGDLKLSGSPYGVAPYGIAIPRPQGAAPGTGPLSKPILDALKKLIGDGVYKQILTKWGVYGPGVGFGGLTTPVINGAVS